MPPALVTDAHSRAAVAGIRALGKAGVRVGVLAARRGAAGLWSRHAAERSLGPPSAEAVAFVERIGELARRHGPLAVFAGQEEAVGALVRAGAALPPEALLPYSSLDAVQAVRDKVRIAALSADAGLASPAVLAEGTPAEVAAAAPDPPCVLKAREISAALPGAVVCESADELAEALEGLPAGEQVMVQERVAGDLVAVSVVLDREGRVAARFQQEALRLWPPTAGASSLGVSVTPDEALIEAIAAMLRAAGYWGLAQIQLLRTARGPTVIDVNPRYYGSLPLATAAGVNLPLVWHRVTVGEPPPPLDGYRTGVTYRWLEGELTAAYNGDWSRLRTRAPRPRAGAMWAWDDPVPGAILAAGATVARVGRRLH